MTLVDKKNNFLIWRVFLKIWASQRYFCHSHRRYLLHRNNQTSASAVSAPNLQFTENMKITALLVLKCNPDGSSDPVILANATDVSHFGYFQRSSVKEFIVFVGRTVAKRTPPSQRQSVQHEGSFFVFPFLQLYFLFFWTLFVRSPYELSEYISWIGSDFPWTAWNLRNNWVEFPLFVWLRRISFKESSLLSGNFESIHST